MTFGYREVLQFQTGKSKRDGQCLEALQMENAKLRSTSDARVRDVEKRLEKEAASRKHAVEAYSVPKGEKEAASRKHAVEAYSTTKEALRVTKEELRVSNSKTAAGSTSKAASNGSNGVAADKPAAVPPYSEEAGGEGGGGHEDNRRMSEAPTPMRAGLNPSKQAASFRPAMGGIANKGSSARSGSMLQPAAGTIRSNDANKPAMFVRSGTNQMGLSVNVPHTEGEWGSNRPSLGGKVAGYKRPAQPSAASKAPCKLHKSAGGGVASFFAKK
ncbi:hypothetical protein T484DRAFT_1770419 [Baffinella frigidus]|nr:hypothetical protein T484DRAFT_1770419 [Cryptophyta sp. CCMP2293]